jgi:hypothetical protein
MYNKILSLNPDLEAIERNTSYITNIYAMPMSDPQLLDRLIYGINQPAREYVLAKETVR